MKKGKKVRPRKRTPSKGWAVFDYGGTPYLDSIRTTRAGAITVYTAHRNYIWELCVNDDGAFVGRVLITPISPPKRKK